MAYLHSMRLNLGRQTLDLGSPRVMGIVNVTPDSFSDPGRHLASDSALEAALRMLDEGAAIIDIGGESTRPGSTPVPAAVQLERILPVIEGLRRESGAPIAVDTGNAVVMSAAVAAGADMINDVYALQQPGALEAAAVSGAGICLMHMRGRPATMQDAPSYDRLPGDVVAFLSDRVRACRAAGIADDRLVVDPGFGFGKTDEHNLVLLAGLGELRALGLPVLVGLSRKGTLGRLTGRRVDERLAAGVAAAVLAVERGASIVRTHDVAATVDALKIAAAVLARAGGSGRD